MKKDYIHLSNKQKKTVRTNFYNNFYFNPSN